MFWRLNWRLMLHFAMMLGVVSGVVFGRQHTHGAALTLENGLLVSTRRQLAVCLEVSPALQSQDQSVRARVAQLLQHTHKHKDWVAAGYGPTVPVPEAGCGAKIPTERLDKGATNAVGRGFTKAPGRFRTVIVVLSSAESRSVLGDRPAALVPFEMMAIDEHSAVEVTSTLVVNEALLDDSQLLDPYLTLALGLEPAQPFMPSTKERSSKS